MEKWYVPALCGLLAAMLGGAIVFFVLDIGLKLGLAFAISLLIFLLFFQLMNFGAHMHILLSVRKPFLVRIILHPLIYFLSLVAILVIPSMDPQVTPWGQIPLVNYLRLFSSILIAFILPGFTIIKAVCRERSLSVFESLLFSFLISIFVTFVTGVSFTFLVTVNLGLLLLSFYITIKEKETPPIFLGAGGTNILEAGTLLCTFLLFFLSVASMFSSFWLFLGPDLWHHYGWALNLMKGIPEIPLYPRCFHILYMAFFQLSGFPYINAYISSVPFAFMAVIGFYLMASAYVRNVDERAPLLSTIIWAFFSGFSWLYVVYLKFVMSLDSLEMLRFVQSKTLLDIGYPPGFWHIMGDNMPAAIGITALFSLLYLTRKTEINKKLQCFLFTITFITGFAIHPSETLFFFIVIPLLLILKKRTSINNVLLSIFFACLFVIALDFAYQITQIGTFFTSTFTFTGALLMLCGTLLGYLFMYLRPRLPVVHFRKSSRFEKNFITTTSIILIYLFGLGMFAWLEIKGDFEWWYTAPSRFVPWYFYPLRLGTAGVLTLFVMIKWRNLRKKFKDVLIFFACFLVFTFSLGRIISYLSINFDFKAFAEVRILSFLFIPIAILASMLMSFLFGKLAPPINLRLKLKKLAFLKRWVVSGLMLAIVISFGTLSTLMTVEYWTLNSRNPPHPVSFDEFPAMEYLRDNTDPRSISKNVADYELVLTLTEQSYGTLDAFSGTGSYLPHAYKGKILFDAKRPEQPLHLLTSYKTKYIYLAQRDHEYLLSQPEGFMNSYFLKNLHIAFENNMSTIYEVPPLSPPLSNSEVGIIFPSDYSISMYDALFMFALSQYNYTTILDSDSNLFSKSVLILPTDWPVQALDDDFLTGWNKTDWKKLLTASSDGGILTLFFNNTASVKAYPIYEKKFPYVIDASTYQYLVWRVFVDDLSEGDYAGIQLYDEDANDWFWINVISSDSKYTRIEQDKWLTLNYNTQDNGWHKFSKVSGIRFVLSVSPNNTQKIMTDYIMFQKDNYNPQMLSELIRWVEQGGDLIIMNSEGFGRFSSLLNMQVSNDSFIADKITGHSNEISIPEVKVNKIIFSDPAIETLANYSKTDDVNSPYAFRKTVGLGSITYLYTEPYLSLLRKIEENNSQRVWMFDNLSSLLKITDLQLPPYNREHVEKCKVTIGKTTIAGSIELSSSSVIFQDSLPKDIGAYDDVEWVIRANDMEIRSSGLGLYARILVKGDFEVTLTVNSTSFYEFSEKTEQPIEFLARTPEVNVNGTIIFKTMYIDEGVVSAYGGSEVTTSGSCAFAIEYADTFTLVSDFQVNSKVQITGINTWDEWGAVPWIKIITSLGHLFFVSVLALCFIFIKLKMRAQRGQ